ncbi:hypothetical protein L207DRAFT_201160 [Hyaloscypha variabilis F]|uniref:Uncharacterized protein n=1 Tax=Hyaloscypha variabilis (strain UAMH 11265 / GT02V1 / F) TaxID=1149755 RepID=A0A2J6QX13_HYAVF|nr:hypothetical protein L207DRAFT_201160 [Hyaloscypha variabilis F]
MYLRLLTHIRPSSLPPAPTSPSRSMLPFGLLLYATLFFARIWTARNFHQFPTSLAPSLRFNIMRSSRSHRARSNAWLKGSEARLNLVVRVSVLVSRCADLAFRRLLNKPLRMLLSSSTSQSEAISTTSCIAERMYR